MDDAPLYIDVTELYELGRKNREITGLARVVVEIASDLCRAHVAVPVINDEARRMLFTVDPVLFTEGRAYDRRALGTGLGYPAKYWDIERVDKGTPDRLRIGLQNAVSAYWRRTTAAPGTAIMGPAPIEGASILCLGSPTTSRRTLARAAARGGFARSVVYIHDILRLHPGNRPETRRAERKSLESCDRMRAIWATNSIFTKNEVARMQRENRLSPLNGEIALVLLAHEMRMDTAPDAGPPHLDGQYILTVGGLDGRKNGALVLDAMMHLLRAKGIEVVPHLIAAGRSSNHVLLREVAPGGRYAALANRVTWIDSPDHATLRGLYRHAAALVYPSRYEGFGLPVGEALWMGTPVLASNAASIPEVGMDLALYHDPDDAEALSALILRITRDAQFARAWHRRLATATARARLRSWETVASELVRLTGKVPYEADHDFIPEARRMSPM